LTGAGSVSAQFAIIRVTGTLTTAKVLTAPSSSRRYVVVNAATGSTVTIKASGQSGVSVAVGETATVYFNGTDYVKSATTTSAPATSGTSILYGNGSGGFSNVSIGTGLSFSSGTLSSTVSVSAATPTVLGTVYGSTDGASTVALGNYAGNSLTSGASNTLIGKLTGYSATTAFRNTGMGLNTLYSLTTGGGNTAIGYQTAYYITTGSDNTIIGNQAAPGFTTGSNNICIGLSATPSSSSVSNEITLGNSSITTFRIPGISITWDTTSGLNSLGVGTPASGTTGEIRATNNITAYYSDDRLKKRLGSVENALDKVRTLDSFYYEANETAQELGYEPIREVGISAQQVQAVLPEVVVPAPISDKYLTVRYERLVPLLIAAIKELEAKVEALENK
jgi:hypothetical protein